MDLNKDLFISLKAPGHHPMSPSSKREQGSALAKDMRGYKHKDYPTVPWTHTHTHRVHSHIVEGLGRTTREPDGTIWNLRLSIVTSILFDCICFCTCSVQTACKVKPMRSQGSLSECLDLPHGPSEYDRPKQSRDGRSALRHRRMHPQAAPNQIVPPCIPPGEAPSVIATKVAYKTTGAQNDRQNTDISSFLQAVAKNPNDFIGSHSASRSYEQMSLRHHLLLQGAVNVRVLLHINTLH